jgi:iron complex outermembrane receptor protein
MGNFVKYTSANDNVGNIVYEASKQPYHPYGLLDLRLQWVKPQYEVYVEGNNLTSYRYYDIGNVQQPGFWLMAGTKWKF